MPRDVSLLPQDFVLSTNPPNPKTSFRLGDWICSSPKCAAHNFGRNLSCIGCGSQRSPSSPTNPARPAISSPRFTNSSHSNPTPPPQLLSDSNLVLQKPSPHHPLLTPSGRAFASGGKVQNISSDPLNPCIMFWPDNEPFPDLGQIRPSGLVGIPQPPILNTGNRGPISHQPGDWVCQKCNYLNWRRRKVCQTCLPYAEGNGDSISAAVQAERIALLTNVLARTRLDVNGNFQGPIQPNPAHLEPSTPAQRSQSLTPPTETTALTPAPLFDFSPSHGLPGHSTINLFHPNEAVPPALSVPGPSNNKSVQRSRSHYALGQQYQHQQHEQYQVQMQRHLAPTPIYQTPLPSSPAPRLMTPQHLPQPQHFQHHQMQMHRNPSPLPVPLLYSTGPPTSPFLGANLGMAGYRMRVLSSPAPAAPRDWNANLIARDSMSSPHAPGSARGSISSLGSLDIPQVRIGVKKEAVGENSGSGSELPTPAITSPLLPAFLRDVVSSPAKNGSSEKEEVLSGRFIVQSPKTLEGVDLSPEDLVRNTPSPADCSLTSRNSITNHPAPQFRARNDSGSSTCSSSSSSSSNLSTSGLSLSLSATSLSSGGCGGCAESESMKSVPVISGRPSRPPSSTSSSSPTITTTVSLCPTPPIDKGPTVSTSTSSLPFMSFGNAGIWKMDGEESKSLKGFTTPPAQPQSRHHHGFGQKGGCHLQEMQPSLILPVGAEKGY